MSTEPDRPTPAALPAGPARPPTPIDAETEADRPEYPPVTMQLLSDVGLNPFAVKLLVESYRTHPHPIPVKFELWGVRFAMSLSPQAVADHERQRAGDAPAGAGR